MSDPWLCGNEDRWILSPQPEGVYDLLVRDLMVDNYKAWNIAKICILFPDHVAERIIATPLISSVYEAKWFGRGREMVVILSNRVTSLLCSVLFAVINTTWKVIGKKYGKRTLHIKHVIFFGAY
jgi:hypothetical protein